LLADIDKFGDELILIKQICDFLLTRNKLRTERHNAIPTEPPKNLSSKNIPNQKNVGLGWNDISVIELEYLPAATSQNN
jgi:hypothetical protein